MEGKVNGAGLMEGKVTGLWSRVDGGKGDSYMEQG
jgi:hypothetical protein